LRLGQIGGEALPVVESPTDQGRWGWRFGSGALAGGGAGTTGTGAEAGAATGFAGTGSSGI